MRNIAIYRGLLSLFILLRNIAQEEHLFAIKDIYLSIRPMLLGQAYTNSMGRFLVAIIRVGAMTYFPVTGSAPVFPSHAGAQQGSVGRVSSQRQRHGQRQNGPAAKPDPDQQAGSRTQAPAQAGQHHRPLQALPLSAQHGQHQVGRRVRERVSSVRMKKSLSADFALRYYHHIHLPKSIQIFFISGLRKRRQEKNPKQKNRA